MKTKFITKRVLAVFLTLAMIFSLIPVLGATPAAQASAGPGGTVRVMTVTNTVIQIMFHAYGLPANATDVSVAYRVNGSAVTPTTVGSVLNNVSTNGGYTHVFTIPAGAAGRTFEAVLTYSSSGSSYSLTGSVVLPGAAAARSINGDTYFSEVANGVAYRKILSSLSAERTNSYVDIRGATSVPNMTQANMRTSYNAGWDVAFYTSATTSQLVRWVETKTLPGADFLEVTFYMYNTTASAISGINIAIGTDVMIGICDGAPIEPLPNGQGFIMHELNGVWEGDPTGNAFILYNPNAGKYGSETAPNWWGIYSSRSAFYNDSTNTTTPLIGEDSEAIARVRGITVPAGAMQFYTFYFGIGEVDDIMLDLGSIGALRAARIGSTEYDTLAEAIAAAQPGQTIVLLKANNENVTITNKSITIDGGAGNYAPASITVNGDVTVSLRNMDFADTPPASGSNVVLGDNSKLDINNTVKDLCVDIGGGTSHIIVPDTATAFSPAVKINARRASLGQSLVRSRIAGDINPSYFTVTQGPATINGTGMIENGDLVLATAVTLTFPGTTNTNPALGNTGNSTWVYATTGQTTFGSSLPPAPAGYGWRTADGTRVTAASRIPMASAAYETVAFSDGATGPIGVYVNGELVNYYDSFSQFNFTSPNNYEIVLYHDVAVSSPIVIPAGTNVTISSRVGDNATYALINNGVDAPNAFITVQQGATLQVGNTVPVTGYTGNGQADDNNRPVSGGVSIDGNGHTANVIVNNGTLVLEDGRLRSGNANAYAIVQNSVNDGRHDDGLLAGKKLQINGYDFIISDVIYLVGENTNIFSTGRGRVEVTGWDANGRPILDTANATSVLYNVKLDAHTIGRVVVYAEGWDANNPTEYNYRTNRYSNLIGIVRLVEQGYTLTQLTVSNTGGEPLVVGAVSNIVVMRKGTDIGRSDNAAQLYNGVWDGFYYGYYSLDALIEDSDYFSTPDDTIYIVDSLSILKGTKIPANLMLVAADRVVVGQYRTVVSVDNVGNPTSLKIVTITDGLYSYGLLPAANGDPKLDYGRYIDNLIASLNSANFSGDNWQNVLKAAQDTKDAIASLVLGTATYGDIAALITDFIFTAGAYAYIVIEQPPIWTGTGDVAWRITGDANDFVRLLLNGVEVDPSHYTVESFGVNSVMIISGEEDAADMPADKADVIDDAAGETGDGAGDADEPEDASAAGDADESEDDADDEDYDSMVAGAVLSAFESLSMVITLSEEFVKTLPAGTHTFIAEFRDGVRANEPLVLTIAGEAAKTGVSENIYLWIMLSTFGAAGIACVSTIMIRRKKSESVS